MSDNTLASTNLRPKGPDLTIRAATTSDADGITALTNLPGFRNGTLRLPHQSPSRTRSWLENQQPQNLSLVAMHAGEIVGLAGLERYTGRRAHGANVLIGVHDDHVRKGIGSALLVELLQAADDWLAISRIELTVFIDNTSAIRLYERVGFEREGVHRNFAFRAGRYVDALAMARLRP